MKNQKKKEEKIHDKVTIYTHPPAPDAPDDDTPNVSAQYNGSVESYLPYLLINCNKYWKFAPNTKNNNMPPNTDAPDADKNNSADALDDWCCLS